MSYSYTRYFNASVNIAKRQKYKPTGSKKQSEYQSVFHVNVMEIKWKNVTWFQEYLELEMKKMEKLIVLNCVFAVNLQNTFGHTLGRHWLHGLEAFQNRRLTDQNQQNLYEIICGSFIFYNLDSSFSGVISSNELTINAFDKSHASNKLSNSSMIY